MSPKRSAQRRRRGSAPSAAGVAAGVSLVGNLLQLVQSSSLREQNAGLREALLAWARSHDAWRAEALERQRKLVGLNGVVTELTARVRALEAERAALTATVAGLERKLAVASRDASKQGSA